MKNSTQQILWESWKDSFSIHAKQWEHKLSIWPRPGRSRGCSQGGSACLGYKCSEVCHYYTVTGIWNSTSKPELSSTGLRVSNHYSGPSLRSASGLFPSFSPEHHNYSVISIWRWVFQKQSSCSGSFKPVSPAVSFSPSPPHPVSFFLSFTLPK